MTCGPLSETVMVLTGHIHKAGFISEANTVELFQRTCSAAPPGAAKPSCDDPSNTEPLNITGPLDDRCGRVVWIWLSIIDVNTFCGSSLPASRDQGEGPYQTMYPPALVPLESDRVRHKRDGRPASQACNFLPQCCCGTRMSLGFTASIPGRAVVFLAVL